MKLVDVEIPSTGVVMPAANLDLAPDIAFNNAGARLGSISLNIADNSSVIALAGKEQGSGELS